MFKLFSSVETPGIGMVESNCDILSIAHSHEKLLYAETLIN